MRILCVPSTTVYLLQGLKQNPVNYLTGNFLTPTYSWQIYGIYMADIYIERYELYNIS